MRPLELSGQVFSRLTVLSPAEHRRWRCRCVCGRIAVVAGPSLVSGNTTSCGCRGRSVLGEATRTHGLRRTPEYRIWAGMIQRCTNSNNPNFKNWGGRGIAVCARWRHNFAAFHEDMGPRPSTMHTLERTNNDGPYDRRNCVWATRKVQSRNHRHNRPLTLNGRTQLLTDWAVELKTSMSTICQRLRRGWSVERALSQCVQRNK